MFEQLFDSLERKSREEIKQEDGDYILNGLLYCGKCNSPKQTRVVIFGREAKPYCLCRCKLEKKSQEEEEYRKKERIQQISKLRRLGFPDAEMARWTFDRDDNSNEKISKIARNYVENFPEMKKRGKGILFYGSVGTGKTFIAACIANALIDRGIPALVTNFSRLVNTIQGMYDGKQDYIDSLNRFDLLVIDDLASERNTEYMSEIIQSIIDSRYRSGLPLIITTNLTADDIKNPDEMRKKRLYSRLYEMCIPLQVAGKDRREQTLINGLDKTTEMLGLTVQELREINVRKEK